MKPIDNETAHELALYAVNDGQLYESDGMRICRQMAKFQLKGKYDPILALRRWEPLAPRTAKKYNTELCGRGSVWFDVFTVPDRADAACIIADHYADQIEYGLNTLKGN